MEWIDTSGNESGFRIYRDDNLVGTVGKNVKKYQDTGLEISTTYRYAVTAYNQIGESSALIKSIRTLNPPIRIHLEQIGVYDNREPSIRGRGDVYVIVAITDGSNAITMKFPEGTDNTYSLDKNETVNIGATVYSTNAVEDSLTIFIAGYESDGGNYEQLAYQALEIATEVYVPGSGQLLEEGFDIKLASIIGDLFGQKHDSLGSYELDCNYTNTWRAGQYNDIVLKDERGIDCLRLWFTIESPNQ